MIDRITALSSIMSFLLIICALLAVANAPATGYELSIYSATPTVFWIAIISGLLNGFFLIASSFYGRTGRMWMVGLFEIVFCNCSVVSLHVLRGYVCPGRYDPQSLVGMAKDIDSYGYFGLNFYPITSIFISQLSQMTNVSVLNTSKYLPSLFLGIYALSVYCWSKSLVSNRRHVLLSLIASAPIFFAWYSTSIYHMLLSVLTIPFFFYSLQKNSDYRFRFFSILWCIIYPFFHPITAIMVFLYLVLRSISELYSSSSDRKVKKVSTTLVLVLLVSLAAWFAQQYVILRNLKRIILQVLGSLEIPTTLTEAEYYFYRLGIAESLRSFFLMVADDIVYSFVALIASLYVLRDRRYKEKLFPIAVCFVGGLMLILVLLVSARIHSPGRLLNLNPNMVLTPPLVSYLIYKSSASKPRKSIKTCLLLGLIGFSIVTSIFSLYKSPITMRPNDHVTISEVTGVTWLISQKDPDLRTADIASPASRFADLIYGYHFTAERRDLHRDLTFPDHFGFTEDNIFPVDDDRYLVITEYDVEAYTEVWKDIARFEQRDFIKIDNCTNADKIYENGGFRTYFVNR